MCIIHQIEQKGPRGWLPTKNTLIILAIIKMIIILIIKTNIIGNNNNNYKLFYYHYSDDDYEYAYHSYKLISTLLLEHLSSCSLLNDQRIIGEVSGG